MVSSSIDEFSIDWIRTDRKVKLSEVHPEADAFQQICGNILADPIYKESSGLNLNLVSFPTLGRDGAIDHFAFTDENETTIVECKKNNSIENSLEEIRKLKDKLFRNLSRKNAINTIYRPWFNNKLKRYIFCTSCQPANASDYEKLTISIKDMMKQIGSISNDLSHLKSVEIQVYSWQQLKGWMERSAFLMYQWVQPDIEGIEYINEETHYSEGYRSYLSSNRIPYISRDDYNQKRSEVNHLPSEKKYLDDLITNTEKNYKGLIIFGEGGIGKTRLMRELAFMGEKKGWQPYRINALVNFKELVSFLKPGGKYILLFDYIEELPEFHEWIENLTQQGRAYEVKIIANCRSSYISNVRILSSSHFAKMDISNSSESSRLYYNNVVNEIIRGIPALKNVNNQIFKYRASFAVFVRYLFDRDKKYDFDLRQNEDFRTWIIRRLDLSFSKLADIKPDLELLTKLFISLPTHGKGKEFLEINYTSEINILINDGWFENRVEFSNPDQKHLVVIHDTLADELLLEYLQRNKNTIDIVIRKFFDFAAKNHCMYGCSRAFERIKDSPILSGVDYVSEFSRIIDNYPAQMKELYYHLVKSSLISEEAMINLYFKHQDFFDPYIKSANFAGPLSYLLNDFSRKEGSEQFRRQVSELFNWWYISNQPNILSNRYASKIISTSIKFFGQNPREQKHLEDYLNNSSSQLEASFVIGAWLNAKGDKIIIEKYLANWLNLHDKSLEARYVIIAWLKAEGDKTVVETHLTNWLKQHHNAFEVGLVIGAWLEAEGDKIIVEKHLVNWLKQYDTFLDARFVIGGWLKTKGDKTIVEKHLVNWLKQHDTAVEAAMVLITWLEAKGDKNIVKKHLANWLKHHGIALETNFVFKAWLEAKGDKTIIEKHLDNWLKQHDTTIETSFVISSWLEAEGDKTVVEKHLDNWLKQHDTDFEADFIITAWLEANGSKSVVEIHVSNWLKQYDSSSQADFVIKAWLEAKGEKAVIEKHLVNWLKHHDIALETSFVFKAWLEAKGDKTIVEKHLANWLKQHDTTIETSFVISSWLEAEGDKTVVEKHLTNWLNQNDTTLETSFAIRAWLEAKGNKTVIEKHLVNWLKQHDIIFEADFIIKGWLEAGGDKTVIERHLVNWLNKHDTAFESSYVIEAWLKAEGDKTVVEKYLGNWLKKHDTAFEASYVIGAWLKAKGELNSIEKHIVNWLHVHGLNANASRIFQPWLKLGGKTDVIEISFAEWLKKNELNLNSFYPLGLWLNNRGNLNIVRYYVAEYIDKFSNTVNAERLLEIWIDAGGEVPIRL